MKTAKKDIYLIASLVFGLTLFVFLFNFRASDTICCPCLISAQVEWTLYQPRPEILAVRWYNACPPQVENVTVMQFERSDFVTFAPDRPVWAGLKIGKDERLGRIKSTDNAIRLQELSGSLEVARADLANISTGQKQPLMIKAARELEYAKEQLSANSKTWKRKQELFERDLISREEMDQAEAEKTLLELGVSVAEAELGAVRTGEKREEVEVAQRQIGAIEAELASVRGKLDDMVIRAPFDGVVIEPSGDSTILSICKLDTVVVQIPVVDIRRQCLSAGCRVRLSIPAASIYNLDAEIASIDGCPLFISGRTRYMARCRIPNPEYKLLAGMTGSARVECRSLDFRQKCAGWLDGLRHSFQMYKI